jgi:type II restriction enzyme
MLIEANSGAGLWSQNDSHKNTRIGSRCCDVSADNFEMEKQISELIECWRSDPEATFQSWFLWGERLKNFRSIRQGVTRVVDEILKNEFGYAYRGSSLETVVHSVAEQKQIFKGADHAFLWKPKLRIPDIYENAPNQKAFGEFLRSALECGCEADLISSIEKLNRLAIKGLGPASANLLYFLHPTIAPPCNTAIVKGYNALTGSRVKLGKWDEYLAMRNGILRFNEAYRSLFSNDLGAVAGFLFDVGAGRFKVPVIGDDTSANAAWKSDLDKVKSELSAMNAKDVKVKESSQGHTDIQEILRDLGRGLGFDVWIAANDRSRSCTLGRLGDGCLESLSQVNGSDDFENSVALIDVLWIDSEKKIVAAFEVEHSTSIYSGVLRLLDLAHSDGGKHLNDLYLVAPDGREDDVRNQVQRPAFKKMNGLTVRYLSYSELTKNKDAVVRFGSDMKAVQALSKVMN